MPILYPFYLMLIDYDNKVRISENKKLLEKIKDNKNTDNSIKK
jgi:hypothetical protein